MTRHSAAVVLAGCLSVAILTLTVGLFLQANNGEEGLNDLGLALLLLLEGSLAGIVGGFLAQSGQHDRSMVGTILAATLGLVALIIAGFVLATALSSQEPVLSANTSKALAAVMGGALGALLGYMGLTKPPDDGSSR